jgi:hypothetical protein
MAKKENAGMAYERALITKMKKRKFFKLAGGNSGGAAPGTRDTIGPPAGADARAADMRIWFPGGRGMGAGTVTNFELKEKFDADFGQLNLQWHENGGNNRFILPPKTEKTRPSAEIMYETAKEFHAMLNINRKWDTKTYTPQRFTSRYANGNIRDKQRCYRNDLEDFEGGTGFRLGSGVRVAEVVEDYYVSKNTYYMQIKGKGLYLMGGNDKFNLADEGKPIPGFAASCANSNLRVRIKSNQPSKGTYSFLIALKIGSLTKSSYDLDEKRKSPMALQ